MNDMPILVAIFLFAVGGTLFCWFVWCISSMAHAARLYIKDYERRRKERIADSKEDDDEEDDDDDEEEPPVRKNRR